ncbi:MAG: hypothetical protein GY940_20025, partial [bacterium]|nr:hypothetical protein [bacterium]
TPPPETPHYQLLPQDLIPRMEETLVDPHKVNTIREARSEKLNKTVELHFVHYSSTYILGTVRAVQNPTTGNARQVTQELKTDDAFHGSLSSASGFLVNFIRKSLNKIGSPEGFTLVKTEIEMDTPNGKVSRIIDPVKSAESMEQMAGVPGVRVVDSGEAEKRDTEMGFRTF